jgi:hypothetical protein
LLGRALVVVFPVIAAGFSVDISLAVNGKFLRIPALPPPIVG